MHQSLVSDPDKAEMLRRLGELPQSVLKRWLEVEHDSSVRRALKWEWASRTGEWENEAQ